MTTKDRASRPAPIRPILIGGVLGILAGVVLGERTLWLQPLAQAYILLITAIIYPYIVCSLLHGIASMSPAGMRRLFRHGWMAYLMVWVLILGGLALLTTGMPAPDQTVFHTTASQTQTLDRIVNLVVPSDPFIALSQQNMPAVVLFSILFGLALQHVEGKQGLLAGLDVLRQACLRFWSWASRTLPVAMFVLFAIAAGTLSPDALSHIGLFTAVYIVAALLFGLVILPFAITAFAPMGMRQVLAEMKDAMMVVIATSVAAAALPYIADMVRRRIAAEQIDDPLAGEVINTNNAVAYVAVGGSGLTVYLLVTFFAHYYNVVIPFPDRIALPFVVLVSSTGSPAAALEFINTWLGLPSQSLAIYLEISTVTRYAGYVMNVASLSLIGLAVVLGYYGKLRIRPARLVATAVLTVLLLGGTAGALHVLHDRVVASAAEDYGAFTVGAAVRGDVKASVETAGAAAPANGNAGSSFHRIVREGVLRVGVNDANMPFVFRNSAGDLAGYDIAFAYTMAAALGVDLVFVPFTWDRLKDDLADGRFDIAMSGIYLTNTRLRDFAASVPYLTSPPSLLTPRAGAADLVAADRLRDGTGMTFLVFENAVLEDEAKRWLPGATFSVVPESDHIDGLTQASAVIATLAETRALARMNGDYAVAVPEGLGSALSFVYLMDAESDHLRVFVDGLIAETAANGWQERETSRWIDGLPPQEKTRRWNLLDDVLGWGGQD